MILAFSKTVYWTATFCVLLLDDSSLNKLGNVGCSSLCHRDKSRKVLHRPGAIQQSSRYSFPPPIVNYCHHIYFKQLADLRKLAKHVSSSIYKRQKLKDLPELGVGAHGSVSFHLLHIARFVAAIDTGTHHVFIRTHGDQRQTCQR